MISLRTAGKTELRFLRRVACVQLALANCLTLLAQQALTQQHRVVEA